MADNAIRRQVSPGRSRVSEQWRRRSDSDSYRIMAASHEGRIFAFIIAPTIVFGNARRNVPRRSHQIFDLVQCAVTERYMLFPGDGRNTANAVSAGPLTGWHCLISPDSFAESPRSVRIHPSTCPFPSPKPSRARAILLCKWLHLFMGPGGTEYGKSASSAWPG
jgi:hypothetical protein